MIGAWLAGISLRLPWAVCAVSFAVMVAVAHRYLEETLPPAERVPFKLKGSNPLNFVKLFRRGPQLRLLAFTQMWNRAFCGRYSTYRYEELHMQQALSWDLQQRGRYASCETRHRRCFSLV